MTETDLTRLTYPEHAKLIPVSGTDDDPDMDNAIDVQFNPNTLKVNLSNTLKENERNAGSRSAQFVDKSSSSLTVELIFDTTYIDEQAQSLYRDRVQNDPNDGRELDAIAVGSDVRQLTKRIAETFVKPVESGDEMEAPSRCLFQWGAFEFIGMVQSYEETLDFFSPEGRPLRASVSLKLSEDRFQYCSKDVNQADRETPTLTATGNQEEDGDDSGGSQDTPPVQQGNSEEQRNWRDTALYNGVESPRLPSASVLAVPKISANASLGISGGVGISGSLSASAAVSASAGITASASASASASAGLSLKSSARATPPSFRFGASTSLGTGIAGAFVTGSTTAGLSAGSLINGGAQLRISGSTATNVSTTTSTQLNTTGSDRINTSVGFD